jgi:AcrR family transcriptional regulator
MKNAQPTSEEAVAARRAHILNTAAHVFAEKGFHRATIRDVARAAGIADGTIYNYFPNKSALLLGLLDRINQTEQRPQHFAQSAEVDLATFFRVYLDQRLATITADGLDVLRVSFSELLVDRELRENYYRAVFAPTMALADHYAAQWAADGTLRSDDPRLTMRVTAAATIGMLMLRLLGDEYTIEQWAAVPATIADLLLHGALPQPGASHEPDPDAEYRQSSI